jgi:hypothetical protein
MKMKLWLSLSLALGSFAVFADDVTVPIYKQVKINSSVPVESVAFAKIAGTYHFVFKLRKDAPKDFTISAMYVYADNDRKTGRPGMGNDYYIVPPKTKLTTYAPSGKGSAAYKIVKTTKTDELLIVSIKADKFANKPLTKFKVTVATAKGKIYLLVDEEKKLGDLTIPELPKL